MKIVNTQIASDLSGLMQVFFCTHPLISKSAVVQFLLLSLLPKPFHKQAATPQKPPRDPQRDHKDYACSRAIYQFSFYCATKHVMFTI